MGRVKLNKCLLDYADTQRQTVALRCGYRANTGVCCSACQSMLEQSLRGWAGQADRLHLLKMDYRTALEGE
jgi:hypothetical protein